MYCKCGCGKITSGKIDHGILPQYVRGHFGRGRKVPFRARPKALGRKAWNKGVKGLQPYMNLSGLVTGRYKGKKGLSGENNPMWKGGKPKCIECGKQLANRYATHCKAHPINKGKNHYFWNGGITPINEKIRKSTEYRLWRIAVFMRDDYTCQSCNIRGEELHADHIKPFALYPELRFAIDNGRTLCINCHRKTDTWGRRRIYEQR